MNEQRGRDCGCTKYCLDLRAESTFCRSHQMFADSSLCLRAVTGTVDASWLIVSRLLTQLKHFSVQPIILTREQQRSWSRSKSPCFSGGETTSWAPASTPGQNSPQNRAQRLTQSILHNTPLKDLLIGKTKQKQ